MELGGRSTPLPKFEAGLLGVLKEGNCTLKRLTILTVEYSLYTLQKAIRECGSNEGFTMMQEISFYILLNFCGRAKARNEKTTKAELVDVIHSVAEAKIRLRPRYGKAQKLKLSDELVVKVRYSLLLESVDKWVTL
jgi:hypothetical protein